MRKRKKLREFKLPKIEWSTHVGSRRRRFVVNRHKLQQRLITKAATVMYRHGIRDDYNFMEVLLTKAQWAENLRTQLIHQGIWRSYVEFWYDTWLVKSKPERDALKAMDDSWPEDDVTPTEEKQQSEDLGASAVPTEYPQSETK